MPDVHSGAFTSLATPPYSVFKSQLKIKLRLSVGEEGVEPSTTSASGKHSSVELLASYFIPSLFGGLAYTDEIPQMRQFFKGPHISGIG
jgi:hypothetical protein